MLPKSDNTAPATFYTAITPSDTVNFAAGECRGIYVGGAGTVVAVSDRGDVVSFVGVAAGTTLAVMAVRVNSTSTTATNLVALY